MSRWTDDEAIKAYDELRELGRYGLGRAILDLRERAESAVSHLNQVHEELGGTDTDNTFELAIMLKARAEKAERSRETDRELLASAERNIAALFNMANGGDLMQPVSGLAVGVRDALSGMKARAEKAEARCAALEAALRENIPAATLRRGQCPCGNSASVCFAQRAVETLSGDTSALRGMLEKAAWEGLCTIGYGGGVEDREFARDIATRVLEGK